MTIHGHSVSGDFDGMSYLKKLDPGEAKVLFEYAKKHGSADFETKLSTSRTNFQLVYKGGEYEVVGEGKERSSGWF